MFLKYKEEASGYPQNIETEEDMNEYILEFERAEGIKLDKSNIKRNDGARSLSKLCLNSFWGRFAMQPNKSQTKWVTNYKEWLDLIAHDKYKVIAIKDEVPGVLIVTFTEKSSNFETTNNTINVVLGAFVTCHARLQLFREMKRLGKRVIYHDTDSIIFSVKEGEYEPKTGNNLGELTDECAKGEWIQEIVCAGPKNYAYRLNTDTIEKPKQKVVVKGLYLNFLALQTLNFSSIKDKVVNKNESEISVDQLTFIRKDEQITTKILKKKYGIKYDKRKILDDDSWLTVPWGYKEKNNIWRPF